MKCKQCGGKLGTNTGVDHQGGYVRVKRCWECGARSLSFEVQLSKEEIKAITGESPWKAMNRKKKHA